MKILVLNGSPKREKSDTMHMTRAFLEGMRDVCPSEVKLIHAVEQNVAPCRGCFTCMRGEGRCVIEDDMRGILEEILASDTLIFSFPLYSYAMPAPLKAIIDRTLPLGKMTMRRVGDHYEHVSRADYSGKRYVMICGCGFPNAAHNFEGMEKTFRLMFGEDSTVISMPESPMFNAPEAEAVTKPRLALLRRAGREFAEAGAITGETRRALAVPMIPEAQYA